MNIRPFEARDAARLAQVFYSSVHEIGAAYYSPVQVDVWAPAPPTRESYIQRADDGRLVLVAVDDEDHPLAYGELELNGHIHHLYCTPKATRTGLMVELYEHLERAAVEQGLRLLYVEASEPAKRFFHRRGFATVHRQDFILRNVSIHNDRMEKRLA